MDDYHDYIGKILNNSQNEVFSIGEIIVLVKIQSIITVKNVFIDI